MPSPTPLRYGQCKARSTPIVGCPREVSARLNQEVGLEAAGKSQPGHRWEPPDMSERLRRVGGEAARSEGPGEADPE